MHRSDCARIDTKARRRGGTINPPRGGGGVRRWYCVSRSSRRAALAYGMIRRRRRGRVVQCCTGVSRENGGKIEKKKKKNYDRRVGRIQTHTHTDTRVRVYIKERAQVCRRSDECRLICRPAVRSEPSITRRRCVFFPFGFFFFLSLRRLITNIKITEKKSSHAVSADGCDHVRIPIYIHIYVLRVLHAVSFYTAAPDGDGERYIYVRTSSSSWTGFPDGFLKTC